MNKILQSIRGVRPEVWVFICAHIAGTMMALVLQAKGLTIGTGDQAARLNFSRFAAESLTPGITQIGFLWRPLLHILLIPLSLVHEFYRTGIAAPLLLVPCFAAATSLLYTITRSLLQSAFWATVASAMFMLNPYILYYAGVPMTEILFILLLFLTAKHVLRWLETNNTSHLLFAGCIIALLFLCRVEGIALLPLLFIIIVSRSIQCKSNASETVALLFLFFSLATCGVAATALYGFSFHGNAFAFLSPESYLMEITNLDTSVATGGYLFSDFLVLVTQIVMNAMWYVIGKPLFWIVGLSLVGLPFVRRKFETYATLAILLIPLIFVVYAMLQRRTIIMIPTLPDLRWPLSGPSGILIDVRYVLTAMGFYILVPILCADAVTRGLRWIRWKAIAVIVSVITTLVLIAASALHLRTMLVSDFAWIRQDMAFAHEDTYVTSNYLRKQYDFGYVLTAQTIYDHRTFIASDIPLDHFIQDANYLFFDQAVREPWLFARWVLISQRPNGRLHPALFALEKNPVFLQYYELALTNTLFRVYRLKEHVVRQMARQLGISPLALPSLNPETTKWNPATIYEQLQQSKTDVTP